MNVQKILKLNKEIEEKREELFIEIDNLRDWEIKSFLEYLELTNYSLSTDVYQRREFDCKTSYILKVW